jgi:hypothetical protein
MLQRPLSLWFYFPTADIPFLVIETHTHFDKPLSAPLPGQQVLLTVNLGQGFFSASIQLELKTIHVSLGFYQGINAACSYRTSERQPKPSILNIRCTMV